MADATAQTRVRAGVAGHGGRGDRRVVPAAALVFFLAPLQGLAERIADRAMPRVRESPEYLAFKKLQMYSAAVETVLSDQEVTERERDMLERMRASLGIGPDDARRLEDDVAGRLRARLAAERGP